MRSSGLVLFSCAGLLLSGGTILGGTVTWSLLRMSYYFWTTDLGVELGTSILFLAGSLLCLPTCWLSTLVPYQTKSTTLNISLMGVVSIAMLLLSLGVTSMSDLTRAVREPAALNTSMLRAMAVEAFDPAVKSSFAAMQMELRCCGIHDYSDWYQHRRALPPACCGRVWKGKHSDVCDVPLFTIGCLRPALTELRYFANTLTTLSSALIIVMAVTLFAATYILISNEVSRTKPHVYNKTAPAPLRVGIACLPQATLPPPCVSFAQPIISHITGNI